VPLEDPRRTLALLAGFGGLGPSAPHPDELFSPATPKPSWRRACARRAMWASSRCPGPYALWPLMAAAMMDPVRSEWGWFSPQVPPQGRGMVHLQGSHATRTGQAPPAALHPQRSSASPDATQGVSSAIHRMPWWWRT